MFRLLLMHILFTTQLGGLIPVLVGKPMLSELIINVSSVVESQQKIWSQADSLIEILNGALILTEFSVGKPPVIVSIDIIRI